MFARALLLLVPATLAAAGEEQAEVKVELESVASNAAQPRLLFPRLPLTLGRDAVEGLPALSAEGRTVSLRAGGKDLRFALDAPEGSRALGILRTRDGKSYTGTADAAGRDAFRVQFSDAVVEGVPLNVMLLYRGGLLSEATAEPAHHRRGRVFFEGAVRVVLLIDTDGDGKFNGADDRWMALREDRSRRVTTLRAPVATRRDEPQVPFEEDGSALMIRDVAEDGSSVRLVRGPPSQPLDRVLTRRYLEFRTEYFAAFGREGESFERRAGLDPDRPRVDEALSWPRETLEAAQERARRSRKPLLVAYYTETNHWWWRYLYTTFRDAEIDRLLRRFELVAIDAEKDPADSYKKSGARALPALQFFTPEGQAVAFRLRSRDKSGEVRELGETKTGITGWQRPADLAANLQRVLAALRPR